MVVVPKALNPYVPNLPEQYTRTFRDYLKDIRFLNKILINANSTSSYTVPSGFTLFMIRAMVSSRSLGGAGSNAVASICIDSTLVTRIVQTECTGGSGYSFDNVEFVVPLSFEQGTTIYFNLPSVAGLYNSLGNFTGFLVPNGDLS